jgi:hypothetical protein
VRDRARTTGSAVGGRSRDVASIAATGFGLTALCIGAEHAAGFQQQFPVVLFKLTLYPKIQNWSVWRRGVVDWVLRPSGNQDSRRPKQCRGQALPMGESLVSQMYNSLRTEGRSRANENRFSQPKRRR